MSYNIHKIESGVSGGRSILDGTIHSVPEIELKTAMMDCRFYLYVTFN